MVFKLIPGEVSQPRVQLHLHRTIRAQTFDWLPLNQLVDEVYRLRRPGHWRLRFRNLHLSRHNTITNIFATLPIVRSSPQHTLVGDYAHGIVIYTYSMILFAHYFWRHITWSAARFFRVILRPYSRDTEIGDLQIPILVEHEIFRFYVAVDY